MSYTFEPESTSPIDFEFKSIFPFFGAKITLCLKVVLSSLKQLICANFN
jgi:hypothetical protein